MAEKFQDVEEAVKSVTPLIKDMQEQIDKLSASLVDLHQSTKKVSDSQEDLTEKEKKGKEVLSEVEKLEAKRVKLQEQLKASYTNTALEAEKLNQTLKQQKKLNTEWAKEQVKLTSAYDKQVKQLKEAEAKYKALIVQGKGNTSTAKKLKAEIQTLSASIQEANEETKKAKNNQQELSAAEKENIKLKQQLIDASSEQAKENQKLRIKIQQQRRATRQAAEEEEGLTNEYDKAKRKLKELKVAYSALLIQGKANEEETKRIAQAITELDASITSVDNSVEDLTESQSRLEKLEGSFNELTGSMGGAGAGANMLIDVFKGLVKNPILGFVALLGAGLVSLFNMFKNTRVGGTALQKNFTVLSATIDIAKKDITDYVVSLFESKKSVKELGKEYAQFINIVTAVKQVVKVVKNLTVDNKDEIDALKEVKDSLIDLQNAYIDIENELGLFIAKQQGYAEIQAAIADDATLSLQKRRKAAEEAAKADEESAEAAIKLAKQQLVIAEAQVEEGIKAGVLRRTEENEIISLTEQGIELERAYTESAIALQQAESQLSLTILENQKRIRELKQDDFEQELDFLLDVADAQKTINEQNIADTRLSYEERRKIFSDTDKLIEDSYNKQLDLFEREYDIRLDRNAIMKMNNKEIFEYARGLGLSEVVTNRLKEVITERRLAVQDLAVAHADLNEELMSSFAAVDSVELESNLKKEGDIVLEATKEYNDKKLELLEEYAEKEKKISELTAQAKQQIEESATQYVSDLYTSRIDSEFEQYETQQDAKADILQDRLDKGEISEAQYQEAIAELESQTETERAKAEKKKALYEVAIQTALGSIKAIAAAPQFFGFPFLPYVIAQGAIQAAAIAATPLGAFKDGTGPAGATKDMFAKVSEVGAELGIYPTGQAFLTPEKESTMFVPQGTKIFSHDSAETQAYLNGGMTPQQFDIMISEERKTRNAILNMKSKPTMQITKRGLRLRDKELGITKNYIGKKVRW